MQPGVAGAFGGADDGGDQHTGFGDQRAAWFGAQLDRVGQVAVDGGRMQALYSARSGTGSV